MITHFASVSRAEIIITGRMQNAMNNVKRNLPFKITVITSAANPRCNIRTNEKFQPDIPRKQTFHIIKITESYHICCSFMADIFRICLRHSRIIQKNHIQHPVMLHRQRSNNGCIFNKSLQFCRFHPEIALPELP